MRPESLEAIDELGQGRVRERVAVVGQEVLVVGEERPHRGEALLDAAAEARVDERDAPVRGITLEQLDRVAAVREDKVVRQGLVMGEEVFLDHLALVSEAQDEFRVSEVGVVLHHVPQ